MTLVPSKHVPLGRLSSVHSSTLNSTNERQTPPGQELLSLTSHVTEQSTELSSIALVTQYPSDEDPSLGAQ